MRASLNNIAAQGGNDSRAASFLDTLTPQGVGEFFILNIFDKDYI